MGMGMAIADAHIEHIDCAVPVHWDRPTFTIFFFHSGHGVKARLQAGLRV